MGAKKRFFKVLTIFLLPLLLSSCGPDLGIFEGEYGENYYESFGDFKGLYDGGSHSYDIEDSLSNEHTINNLDWEDDDDKVEKEAYLYLILPFEKELKIQAIVLFFKTDINVKVEFSTYYFINESSAPQKIKYLSSPDTETVHDPDLDEDVEKEIEYDDPKIETSLATGSVSLYKDEWNSCSFGGFDQEGYNDGYLHTGVEGLLYIRVENNSGFNRETKTSVSFTFINLLVRAVE